jgi:hypothetical protein
MCDNYFTSTGVAGVVRVGLETRLHLIRILETASRRSASVCKQCCMAPRESSSLYSESCVGAGRLGVATLGGPMFLLNVRKNPQVHTQDTNIYKAD